MATFAFGVALFAARAGWAQQNAVGPVPQAVVTREDTFLPGQPQMIAPAYSDITMHPQGRYVLVSNSEASLPYASLLQKSVPHPAALLLYDARLRKVRTLWEGHAPHREYFIWEIHWLPQSDCALVNVYEGKPYGDEAATNGAMASLPDKATLLFYNFAQSTTGRAIAYSDSPDNLQLSISPTKPNFLLDVSQDAVTPRVLRMGSTARGGALGPPSPFPEISVDFSFEDWNVEGTAIYCTHSFRGDPVESYEWYVWNGKTPDMTPLPGKPDKEKFARNLPQPPALMSPLALRTGVTVVIPASLPTQTVSNVGAKAADAAKVNPLSLPPPVVLHPLYLEAADAPAAQANPNRSTLIAPDADTSFLMPDQSAVLYQKGGATYVVPLTRIKNSAFVQLQKDVTLQNARTLADIIFTYERSGSSTFPTKTQLTELVKKERDKHGDGDTLLRGFAYTPPNVPLRDMDAPETVAIGVLTAPKGRAVIYATGNVKWEDNP